MTKFKSHPVLSKLSQLESGETAVTLRGYVGPSTEQTVRLFADLALDSLCVEIPADDILHAEENDGTGRTILYVKDSSTIIAIDGKDSTSLVLKKKKDDDKTQNDQKIADCISAKFKRCLDERIIDGSSLEGAVVACTKNLPIMKILCEVGPLGPGGGGGSVIV